MADLLAVNEKIIRAEQHLATFGEEVMAYLKACKHTIEPKVDRKRAQARIFYRASPDPPIRLSILLGDVIYNTRSALDQLVCCIVRSGKPTSSCSGRQFPICVKADEWPAARQSLRGLPPEAKTIIEGLQPCMRPTTADIHPLTILNTLSNRDKHRAPVLTSTYSQTTLLRFIDREGGVLHWLKFPKSLASGTHIVFTGVPEAVKPGVDVNVQGTSIVAFKDTDPWRDREAAEVIHAPIQFVKQFVIPRLKPFVH